MKNDTITKEDFRINDFIELKILISEQQYRQLMSVYNDSQYRDSITIKDIIVKLIEQEISRSKTFELLEYIEHKKNIENNLLTELNTIKQLKWNKR